MKIQVITHYTVIQTFCEFISTVTVVTRVEVKKMDLKDFQKFEGRHQDCLHRGRGVRDEGPVPLCRQEQPGGHGAQASLRRPAGRKVQLADSPSATEKMKPIDFFKKDKN